MEDLKKQFKALLIQSLDNENEAARELAKEAAIKFASNFTEEQILSQGCTKGKCRSAPISAAGQTEIGKSAFRLEQQ
jgi:hypothetical protein